MRTQNTITSRKEPYSALSCSSARRSTTQSRTCSFGDLACRYCPSLTQRNKIKNRAFSKQVSSNDPIEDRLAYDDLTSVDGFVASVFDGHGGWQLCRLPFNYPAEFASKSLHNFLDHNFKVLGSKTPTDEQVIAVINKSFDEVVGGLS